MFRRVALIGIVVAAGLIVLLLLVSGREGPPAPPPPRPPEIAMTSPEVVVGWKLPLSDVDTGEQIGVIEAKEAVVYKDRTVDVTEPVIRLTRQPDRPVTITAPTGKVDIERKTAVLRASPTTRVRIQAAGAQEPMSMDADEVHWHSTLKQVTTSGPVTMHFGRARILGTNLRSEAEMTQFVLPQDVRVELPGTRGALLGGREDVEETIEITCAGALHFDRSRNQATFQDAVLLTRGKRTLRCDQLDILLEQDDQGETRVRRASARGGPAGLVRIIEADGPEQEPTGTLTGSAVDYDAQTGLLTIAGPIEAQDPTWRVTGERMSIDATRKRTTIEGSPALAESPEERLEASSIILDESQEPHLLIAQGEPAHAYRGPHHLVARELHMAQDTGVLTVPGPGELHWQSQRGLAGVTSEGPSAPADEAKSPYTTDVVWAESMRFAQGRAHFKGSVQARQETTILSAGQMEIIFDETASAIREVTAEDEVEIVDPPQTIRAQHFSLDLLTNVMHATGTVEAPAQVWLDRDVLRAPTVTFKQKSGDVETDGPGSLLYHSGAGDEVQPLRIAWGTEMTYDGEEGVARFQDAVELIRESFTLTSDRLSVFFARSGERPGLTSTLKIVRAVATGRVVAAQPASDRTLRRAAGDTLTWDAETATLMVVGEPALLWQGSNVIKSAQVIFDNEKHLVLAPGPGRLIVYNEEADSEGAPEGPGWQKVQINWQQQLRYDTLSREAEFQGDVFVREGTRTLYARDTLTAYFTQDEQATLTRALAEGEALGDVTVTQGDRSGLGTWFEWDVTAESVQLRGTPYALLRQGANEVRGRGFRFEKGASLQAEGTTFVDFLEQPPRPSGQVRRPPAVDF